MRQNLLQQLLIVVIQICHNLVHGRVASLVLATGLVLTVRLLIAFAGLAALRWSLR